MKKISFHVQLIAFILPFLLLSCNEEDNDLFINNQPDSEISNLAGRKVSYPSNPNNPYDATGYFHNEILDLYLSGNYNHSIIDEITDEITQLIYQYTGGTDSIVIDDAQIEEILVSPEISLLDIVASSSLTNNAQTELLDFIETLFENKEDEFESLYTYITSYETAITASSQFSSEDKRVILTLSSIARYSVFYEKKRKDKDWEISVGNIVAGTGGALESSLSAVSMALAGGIGQKMLE